jgi:hypothetical protein
MKKAYQIDERRAIEKFRSHLLNDRGTIQMILALAEIAQGLRNGGGERRVLFGYKKTELA